MEDRTQRPIYQPWPALAGGALGVMTAVLHLHAVALFVAGEVGESLFAINDAAAEDAPAVAHGVLASVFAFGADSETRVDDFRRDAAGRKDCGCRAGHLRERWHGPILSPRLSVGSHGWFSTARHGRQAEGPKLRSSRSVPEVPSCHTGGSPPQ